jgi:hypothetical protein
MDWSNQRHVIMRGWQQIIVWHNYIGPFWYVWYDLSVIYAHLFLIFSLVSYQPQLYI